VLGKKILSDKKVFMYQPFYTNENKKKNRNTNRSEKNKLPWLFPIHGRIAYHRDKSQNTLKNKIKKISHKYLPPPICFIMS
jgi:hypothetical protein